MKRLSTFCTLLSILLLALSSCSNEDQPTLQSPGDIYICGTEKNAAGKSVAKYWKNGVEHILTDGTFDASARYIYVDSNRNVYVTGIEKNSSGINVAKYWKNGISVSLSDGLTEATCGRLRIVGNDVYVVGEQRIPVNATSFHNVAKYWKNGIEVNLTPPTSSAHASDIEIHNGDVYVAGTVQLNNGTNELKYWKNGVPVHLVSGAGQSYSTFIKFHQDNLYVGGYGIFDGGYYRSKIWKNGTLTEVSGDTSNIVITNVILNNNDIIAYAMEFQFSYHYTVANYYRNGTPSRLEQTKAFALPSEAVIKNGDLYAVGHERQAPPFMEMRAVYWKNTVRYSIGNPEYESSATGIFIY